MWRRLRRRGRPAVFADQWPLVPLTAVAIAGGIVVVIWVLGS